MRIAVTSDLHCDVTPQNRKLAPYLANEIGRLSPDALILAGDLANTLTGWADALHHFRHLDLVKLVIPGNHDVWIESKNALRRAQDSAWKNDVALRDIATEHGFHYLPGSPLVVGTVGFAGSLGWYDYSLRDHRLDATIGPREYRDGRISFNGNTGIWNDSRRAAWLRYPRSEDWRQRFLKLSDREVCQKLTGALEAECEQIIGRVTKIVVVIHTNPFRRCIPAKDEPDPFDAYEGSVQLGELLTRLSIHSDVLCVCGHRHQQLDMIDGGVRVVRAPIGYLNHFDGDYASLAAKVVRVCDV